MVSTKNVERLDLNLELETLRKKRNALTTLLNDGKISGDTAIPLIKRFDDVEAAIIRLKQFLNEEKNFWRQIKPEGIKILESLLVKFRFLNLIGEINEEKWFNLNETIICGLNALKSENSAEFSEKNDQDANKGDLIYSPGESINAVKSRNKLKSGRRSNSNSPPTSSRMENSKNSILYCMNPWKPDCRGTDIELSIYYNGRFIPICRKCWKEISEKDVEWST